MEEKIWHDLWWFHNRVDSVGRYDDGGIKMLSSRGISVPKGINNGKMGGIGYGGELTIKYS